MISLHHPYIYMAYSLLVLASPPPSYSPSAIILSQELWSLLNFLNPKKFYSLDEFQERYAEIKEQEQITRLHEELKPHLLRRVKKDVEKVLL